MEPVNPLGLDRSILYYAMYLPYVKILGREATCCFLMSCLYLMIIEKKQTIKRVYITNITVSWKKTLKKTEEDSV